MFFRSRLFEKRCGKAEYFPEEGTICNFLDQSFWDRTWLWPNNDNILQLVHMELGETGSAEGLCYLPKISGSG